MDAEQRRTLDEFKATMDEAEALTEKLLAPSYLNAFMRLNPSGEAISTLGWNIGNLRFTRACYDAGLFDPDVGGVYGKVATYREVAEQVRDTLEGILARIEGRGGEGAS